MKPLETSQPYNVTSHELIQMEPVAKRVRVIFNGETIADSEQALLMLEVGRYPVYYFPQLDIRMDLLEGSNRHDRSKIKGTASYWHIRVGDQTSENAVWSYLDPIPEREDIKGYMAFYWDKVDAWFEGDEQIFGHPRNPYKKIEYLSSSSHIQVIVRGEIVADTRRPMTVLETGMPTTYYIPNEDIRMEWFEPSDRTTYCPYKGKATYWLSRLGDQKNDIMWSYQHPLHEAQKISGLFSFYPNQVDAILIDGEPMQMITITESAQLRVKNQIQKHEEMGIRVYFKGID